MVEPEAGQIVNVMKEDRLFPPPAEFAAKARIGSLDAVRKALERSGRGPPGLLGTDGRRTPLVPAL